MPGLDTSPAWLALQQHRHALKSKTLAEIILDDPQRLDHCTLRLEGLRLNYALHYVTAETIGLLVALAEQQDLQGWRNRMEQGEKINISENRAALHMALRQTRDDPVLADGVNVMPEIRTAHHRMAEFVGAVRDGSWRGVTGQSIKHIINLGVGGSDLGPRMVVQALDSFASGPKAHFVANADAFDIGCALNGLDPTETLCVIVSKTFTTQETLMNAQIARRWIIEKLGEGALSRHFIAVSSNPDRVQAFGIPAENSFPVWEWVGGRFSLWSAVGISIALALGMEHFDHLCAGAAVMDEHFRSAPLRQNLPVMLGLIDLWNRNFLPSEALAILPYAEKLRELPRYLQQLEMESNGKTVMRDGAPITYATAPLVFGESGSVGQHSFYQWLHQGSAIVPAHFIGIAENDTAEAASHRALQTNMAAQVGALAFGQTQSGMPFEHHAGGRPATLLMLDRLDPYHFGLLIALYEHKVFTQGVLWEVNPFDQPGVELGKKLARRFDRPSPAPAPEERFLNNLLKFLR